MHQHDDKIFNNLSISPYHFHSLCLLILMPYHLYFLCPGTFFLAVRTQTLFTSKVLQPDILQSNELEKCYFFFMCVFVDVFTIYRWMEKRNNFNIVHATQSANNIDAKMLCVFALTKTFSSFLHTKYFFQRNMVFFPFDVFQLIYSPPGKLWLLYKIGFLFCGNYPFLTVHTISSVSSSLEIKTYARTSNAGKKSLNWKRSTFAIRCS